MFFLGLRGQHMQISDDKITIVLILQVYPVF